MKDESKYIRFDHAAANTDAVPFVDEKIYTMRDKEQLIAAALSSRDAEIREVLEGLRNEDGDCWCVHFGSDYHAEECEQAQRLYNRLQPVKEGENGDQL